MSAPSAWSPNFCEWKSVATKSSKRAFDCRTHLENRGAIDAQVSREIVQRETLRVKIKPPRSSHGSIIRGMFNRLEVFVKPG